MITALFYCKDMAMLPESARTAAAYLGGGIARGIEQKGAQVAQAGKNLIKNTAREVTVGSAAVGTQGQRVAFAGLQKDPIGGRVGEFLQNIGSQAQQFGASVGTKGAIKKRDVGLAAVGAAMAGTFVGGMGANAGINALIGFQATNPRGRVPSEQGRMGGNVMPSDLQTSYIALNQPGSPLGMQQMRLSYDVKSAQERQRLLRAAMGPETIYNNGPEAES